MKKTKAPSCHSCDDKGQNSHPDHSKELNRINRMAGQLEGIKRMIESREYCPNILIQTKAVRSALKGLEANILRKHIESCVRDALNSKNKATVEEKIEELTTIFRKKDS